MTGGGSAGGFAWRLRWSLWGLPLSFLPERLFVLVKVFVLVDNPELPGQELFLSVPLDPIALGLSFQSQLN